MMLSTELLKYDIRLIMLVLPAIIVFYWVALIIYSLILQWKIK